MIDIHTHILPSIDDGSNSISETFKMIHEACDAGFSDIITTSHYIENEYNTNKNDRNRIIQAIQNNLNNEKDKKIQIHNGAEIFVSNNMLELIESGEVPTLADSRYVLFELPMHTRIIFLDNILEQLIGMQYVPVIAHPERYDIVKENPNLAIEWVKKGALLQSNYASIVGRYGEEAKQTQLKLLNANAIHFLGTDTHRSSTNYILMEEYIEKYEKEIGKEKLIELSTEHPQKVLLNEEIEIEQPKKIRKIF